MTQKWKTDESLYGAETEVMGDQITKKLDYDTVYRKEFLDSDPVKDWDSVSRCIWLWEWALEFTEENPIDWYVLDVGTKDCQFPMHLVETGTMAVGVEYSKEYVDYADKLGRPIVYGDACNLGFEDDTYDLVFSHHVHGLVSDYRKALDEMYRVSSKYMIALNQVPGNPRKHYSYINSPQIFHKFVEDKGCRVIYNDYLDTGFINEWVIFVEKNE
jgi:SAM-dependent methyltransferase